MNERIQKLANQAGFCGTGFSNTLPGVFRGDALENFAELIVLECAEFARRHNLQKADRSHMIHQAMKEHFGVEEWTSKK